MSRLAELVSTGMFEDESGMLTSIRVVVCRTSRLFTGIPAVSL